MNSKTLTKSEIIGFGRRTGKTPHNLHLQIYGLETNAEYTQKMIDLGQSTQVSINEDVSVRRSFYDENGQDLNTIEIGYFDRFEISLKKAEALKLIDVLQKMVKEL